MHHSELVSTLIPFTFPHAPFVHVFFSTALTGNMAITKGAKFANENVTIQHTKEALIAEIGLEQWVEIDQIHGDDLVEVSQEKADKTAPLLCADGLFTCCERKALTIRTADCQAILFAHTKGKFIAAIHVGWRGNLKKFPQTAVEFLCKKYTVKASEIMAVRGPSLGPGASEFIHFEKEWPVEYCPWFDTETKLLDLWGITRYQLEMSGIMEENIFSIDMCTKSLPEVFFSHRNGHTERQVAAIWIDRNRPQC